MFNNESMDPTSISPAVLDNTVHRQVSICKVQLLYLKERKMCIINSKKCFKASVMLVLKKYSRLPITQPSREIE